MAKGRIDLHTELVYLLGTQNEQSDKQRVYFQQPSTIKISYPCIIYKLDAQDEVRANNNLYRMMKRYLITVIDKNPDSTIPDRMMNFKYCSFVNYFTIDNLNHYNYSLYY